MTQTTNNSGVRAAWDADFARSIACAHKGVEGPLLPILHALIDAFGYIDERAIPIVADVLNLSRADVHGVVTFYHDFRREPAGRHIIKICMAESCQSMGCHSALARLESVLGIKINETTTDGRITLEPVYCLGNCALSPAALFDDTLYGRLNGPRLDALINEARR